MKSIFIIFSLLICKCSTAQKTFYPEELAIYYIDTLIQTDPDFIGFKYSFRGYLSNAKSDTTELCCKSDDNNEFKIIKLPCSIIIKEDSNLISFNIPKRMRNNGSSRILKIYHFSKTEKNYFVSFSQADSDVSGISGTIIMDFNGNLTNWRISNYVR